ncbi:ATP-binding protein [Sphaerisporangium fuscum]|uniref:ATP-binding protein n=1 Tax=Sphaerisporangium fuscum TaxID=2835868 RepID=UPI001BDD74AB|nr:ATP-binding protein [Sphaerisporangium fuscum]
MWETLGEAHPVVEEVVSELVAESVRYSNPHGRGQLEVKVSQVDGGIRVAVTGPGSLQQPRVRQDPPAESGRGLLLVDAISERWGTHRTGTTWFTIRLSTL